MLNAIAGEPRINVQLSGGNLAWAFESLAIALRPKTSEGDDSQSKTGLQALYARLAREYDELPSVATRCGGLPGEAVEI